MASVKIVSAPHPNKKGLVSVYLLVVHNRQKSNIPIIGLKVTAEFWNENTFIGRKDPEIKNYKLTNDKLKGYELKASQTINQLAGENALDGMDIAELVNAISLACFNASTDKKEFTFGSYTDTVIAQLKQAKQYGTADCYADAKSFVERRYGRDVRFQELTYTALKKMEASHYGDNKGVNSLSYYMRTIRAIYNRAAKDKLVNGEYNPFKNYKIKSAETKKRAIPLSDFTTFKDHVLPVGSPRFHSHNYFMFSFYLGGMNFIDLAYLKVSDIIGDRIDYSRSKTGKLFSMEIPAQVQKILDNYLPGKKSDDYVFPILKSITDEGKRNDIENQRRNYNKLLKKIAKDCSITLNLTSYVARHSWATIGKLAGVPIAQISEGLGHRDSKTTQIYLDSFPNSVMDNARNQVANLLDKAKEQDLDFQI